MITDIQMVRQAADVLEELSRMYESVTPEIMEWSADDIRAELPHIQDHLDHGKIVQDIARSVMGMVSAGSLVENAVKSVLKDYEMRRVEP